MSTSDLAARIAQFENMAQADPENEMAHYSLGNAYMQSGRFDDAAQSYLRCTELAPSMSKAYQLAGDCMIKGGQKDKAADLLKRGYLIASERGDRMPQSAIADLLRSIGQEVPTPPASAGGKKSAGGGVNLLGGPAADATPANAGAKLTHPPFKGPLGAWIFQNVSQDRWEAWIRQGTKVINELRLDLSKEQDGEAYDQHMREYLGIDDETYQRISGRA